PYKICKLNLSRLKASKNLEFLEIASVALLPRNDEILEFPSLKQPLSRSPKGSANLEFLA
ncbi:MAG: hypothetical protein PUB35_03935, partial [Campylobacteraceae bacterium]|nr:hypothetical protein [Campylobacteraceae bacterium]